MTGGTLEGSGVTLKHVQTNQPCGDMVAVVCFVCKSVSLSFQLVVEQYVELGGYDGDMFGSPKRRGWDPCAERMAVGQIQ